MVIEMMMMICAAIARFFCFGGSATQSTSTVLCISTKVVLFIDLF